MNLVDHVLRRMGGRATALLPLSLELVHNGHLTLLELLAKQDGFARGELLWRIALPLMSLARQHSVRRGQRRRGDRSAA